VKQAETVEWARQQLKEAPIVFGFINGVMLATLVTLLFAPPYLAPIIAPMVLVIIVCVWFGAWETWRGIKRAKRIIAQAQAQEKAP